MLRYIDDEFHTLVDIDVFDSASSLYDERTVFDGSQDGTDSDGIYPRVADGPGGIQIQNPFELEAVFPPSRAVNYCDWRIWIDTVRGKVMTRLYDKRHDMPLFRGARTFPHRSSLIHQPAKYNVIVSQFLRFAHRSTTMTDCVAACADLASRMILHGYAYGKVLRQVRALQDRWRTSGAKLGRWRDFSSRFDLELARLLRRR